MTDCFIRAATNEDAAAVAGIYGHFVLTSTATFELEPPDAAEIVRRMDGVRGLGLPYLVAEHAGRVVGYAYATQYRPRAAYRFTAEDSVYVHASWTGRGIGGRLLTALIAACREAGSRQMVAGMGGDNPASVALHKAHGFEHIGVLRNVGFKFETWLDVTLMQLTL
jgi:L-amino acid N-acyltransferase YncA